MGEMGEIVWVTELIDANQPVKDLLNFREIIDKFYI